MGIFKSIGKALTKAVLGPQESDYPDKKSYLKARLEYTKNERSKIERNMREASKYGTANPNDLDRIAKLSDEIRDIERQL